MYTPVNRFDNNWYCTQSNDCGDPQLCPKGHSSYISFKCESWHSTNPVDCKARDNYRGKALPDGRFYSCFSSLPFPKVTVQMVTLLVTLSTLVYRICQTVCWCHSITPKVCQPRNVCAKCFTKFIGISWNTKFTTLFEYTIYL